MVGSGEKRRRRGSFIRGLGGGGGRREELRLSPKSFLPLSPQAEETPVGPSETDLPNFKCVIEECGKK